MIVKSPREQEAERRTEARRLKLEAQLQAFMDDLAAALTAEGVPSVGYRERGFSLLASSTDPLYVNAVAVLRNGEQREPRLFFGERRTADYRPKGRVYVTVKDKVFGPESAGKVVQYLKAEGLFPFDRPY